MKKILFLTLCLTLLPHFSGASIKVIEAESSYAIGDNNSKIDARRIAIQEAKRKVLEEAGTFVASLTEVKDYQLTKDEVTAYTAGVVETEIVNEEMRGTVDKPEIHIEELDNSLRMKEEYEKAINALPRGALVVKPFSLTQKQKSAIT